MKWLRAKILNWMIKKLIRPITDDDILKIVPAGVIYKGRILDDMRQVKLSEDAKNFANSTIWKLLQDEALLAAYQRGSSESMNFDDVIMSKAMIYLLDVLKTKVKKLSQLK